MTYVDTKLPHLEKQDNDCYIHVRLMQRNEHDCRFVAELKVEAKQREYIHATSKGSLDTIQRVLTRNHEEQDDWFFSRTFIVECDGEPVGILALTFPSDPRPIQGDYEMDFGCTDLCGLACLKCGIDETVRDFEVYVNFVYVLTLYRDNDLLSVLLKRAESEARKEKKEKLFLYVPFGNPVKQFYTEHGYNAVYKKCCCVWCAMGNCGYYRLEKYLAKEQPSSITQQPS